MADDLSDLALWPIHGGEGDARRALELASPYAPYLARLLRQNPEVVERLVEMGPSGALAHEVSTMRAAADAASSHDTPMKIMRKSKEAAHLVIAGADLSGLWTLDQVVEGLSDLAEAAVRTALTLAVATVVRSGRLPADKAPGGQLPGLFVLAMGKLGARELNYSSDIDLVVLYDRGAAGLASDVMKDISVRITRELVRILDERRVEGYVFRTDLRLRPDPSSTPIAVSTDFAEVYYESVGQNWERMAHIKARVCAGDAVAGAAYLNELAPYIWRRHLDYWAIADIHSIKRQIHSHGQHAALGAADFDVKLGRGGIREIEFFAQVQQLILGGRFPALRSAGTKTALDALTRADVISGDVQADLLRAYDFLRRLEHRIQMVNDEQTHRLPDVADKRLQIAALSGRLAQPAFEAEIIRVRQRVHGVYSDLFAQEERLSGEGGNLVFTGVDDDPGTIATLREMGFSDPSKVIRAFQAWHRGGVPATRSARGRQLLTTLGPRLLKAMAEAGQPDQSFDRFSDFFSAIAGGVQTMSLMLAEPALTRDLVQTMTFAPKLATDLARRPALLDAMMEPRFQLSVSADKPGEREQKLRDQLARTLSFEERLNIARRFHREEAFRIGYQLLRGKIHAADAGAAYADLADACVAALALAAAEEVMGRFHGTIGRWVVCGLGKLGGRELSASSDIDIMLVYERDDDEPGENLAPRFVQRLIAALSAPTEEGTLYDVDTQLRPSGRAGPVAVKMSSFAAYYETDAWTWEFMALTRLRPIAGDAGLSERIVETVCRNLRRKSADPMLSADIADMRRRMARERPAKSRWDLKLAPGGLVDIEFVIQHEVLKAAGNVAGVVHPTSRLALEALHRAKRFTDAEAVCLGDALDLQLDLQQALRIAAGKDFDPASASPGLRAWLAGIARVRDFAELEALLSESQRRVAAIREAKIGPLATEG